MLTLSKLVFARYTVRIAPGFLVVLSQILCDFRQSLREFDVRESVHHSTIHKKFQQDATMYQNFIIPYLYEAQHVSGDTPPIIRSLKLH